MGKILSQRDPKWASQRLGWGSTNKTTIGSHGCTITCISMLTGLTPDVINKKFIEHKVYAAHKDTPNTFNLVNWQFMAKALPQVTFKWRSYAYDNDKVKAAITRNGGCLVEVDGKRIGASRHWVLYVGGGKMYDPWFGTEKLTTYYPVVGYADIDVKVVAEAQKPEQQGNDEVQTLLTKYNVKTVKELDEKIFEHVGEDWGATKDSGLLGGDRAKLSGIEETVKKQIQEASEDHDRFVEKLVELLKPSTSIPNLRLEQYVIQATEELLNENAELSSKLRKVTHNLNQQDKKDYLELDELKRSVQKIETVDVERLISGIDNIKQRISVMEEKKAERSQVFTSSRIKQWFESLWQKPQF